MKYLKQFLIIVAVSFVGEILHYFLPIPIPASIYGIVIMFVCLMTHIIKLEHVHETANFLIEIMPVMFIPAAVGILESWGIIQSSIIQYLLITVVTTIMVMIISGKITQLIIRKGKDNHNE